MDIISQLWDDLLLRILSCLKTKDVAGTSLLSKRWRNLWMLTPKLKYNNIDHSGDYKSFLQFVYRSLLSNKAPVLKKLSLNIDDSDCSPIDIRIWIDIAVSRRVRELEIDMNYSNAGPVSLPSSLYTCDALETLRLTNFILLIVPSSVYLPSLRILRLELIDSKDEDTLPRLLCGCPNLEELFVNIYYEDTITDVRIVVPSLQRLAIYDDTRSRKGGRYVIDAPSLKYLDITDHVVYDFREIENMPELVKAEIGIKQKVPYKFLRALTSVQHLSLDLSLSEATHPSGIIFNQLVSLKLWTSTEGWWDLLTHMLQDSPKLKILTLTDETLSNGNCGKETPRGWKPPSSTPEGLLYSLEAFVWKGYKGRQGDKKVAAYVLNNAASLKTATFSPKSTSVDDKYKMLKELASVARASTTSQLLFD